MTTLLLLVLALGAWAGEKPKASKPPLFETCLPAGDLPSTLDELLDCQESKRRSYKAKYAQRIGGEVPAALLDKLDEFQRSEARRFAQLDRGGAAGGAAAARNRSKVPKDQASALAGLESQLHEMGGGGEQGITPDMAKLIAEKLVELQGGMSPEMQGLLRSVEKDGSKLTESTMKQLSGAAKAAKLEGLDLGIDPDIERQLLELQGASPASPSPSN